MKIVQQLKKPNSLLQGDSLADLKVAINEYYNLAKEGR